jgi:enamine deaminase RidA (YjgF/YER057c/UK114 family)
MTIEHINPPGLFKYPGLAQAMAVTGGKTIYVAGQTAMDEQMNVVGGDDCYAQAVKAFENLAIALKAAGASFNQVVSTTIYIRCIGPKPLGDITRAMQTAFDGSPIPDHAMTMIGVAALGSPLLWLEVAAVAVV